MATINFIMKSSRKGTLATIYVRFREGRNIDLVASTKKSIQPDYWSKRTQTIKQRITDSEIVEDGDVVSMDDTLTQLKDFVAKERFLLSGIPTSKWLKEVIQKFNKIKFGEAETLNMFIQRYIDEIGSGKRYTNTKTKTRYTAGTVKNYVSFQTQFNEFQEKIKSELDFQDINIDTYKAFLDFFNHKNYSTNTTGRMIKALKAIMRAAREEGLHDNEEYERKAFSAPSAYVENIYLNESELNKIAGLELTGEMETARDVFLVGCYTAQRYSDYSRITSDNIITVQGKKFIELIQKKTKVRVRIPIMPELEAILKKYNYRLPKTWEQKVNENIKKVGEKAGIIDTIQINESKGGLSTQKTVKKYELIVTHTARRSGITNMYLNDIKPIDIMKFSGHKTEKQLLDYIKTGMDDTAEKLSSHPYFNNQLKVAK